VGLGNEPIAQLASVAHAFNAQPVTVDPQISAHGRAKAIEHVLGFIAVLVAKYCIGEFLAVAGRSAIVDQERGPAMSGIDLVSEDEGRSLLSVGAAVDIHDQRIFALG